MFDWRSLPPPLQEGLLHGAVGKMHCFDLARKALASESGKLAPLGLQLLRWAWENDPMDGGLAAQLENAAGHMLPGAVRDLLKAVAASYGRPQRLDYLVRLYAKGDQEKLRHYLEQQCAKEPNNLFWLQQALGQASYTGTWDQALMLLDLVDRPSLAPVLEKARADISLFSGNLANGLERYAHLAETPGLWSATLGQAEALCRAGRLDEALAVWGGAAGVLEWNTNLLLRLFDAATGRDRDLCELSGKVAVLLYTYNKSGDLEKTLRALSTRLADNVTLFVLDNGCTDATPLVLNAWRQRLGSDRMRLTTLPVNVGAPAARNWLAAVDAVRGCDWVAYVDDDAPPPEDWLQRLGAASKAYPDAGVWGGRVVDGHNAHVLQHVDLHLCDPPETESDPDAPAYARRFGLSRLHHQVLDSGQFTYCRPCATVTGCVHLFRQEVLERSGGFDLRFTPSQYDDVEHDLRLLRQGYHVVYQGHLAVPHMKRSGRAGRVDARENARALGNQYKLQLMYTRREIQDLRQGQRKLLLADVLFKRNWLAKEGLMPPIIDSGS